MYDPAKEAMQKEHIERMERNLTNHPPKADLTKMHMERLRADAKSVGISILSHCPESVERDRAMESLELTVMWSMAAIARNQ